MIKTQIIKRIQEYTNGAVFISRKELAAVMGYKDPHHVAHFLVGLPKVGTKFFVDDVAESIVAKSKLN